MARASKPWWWKERQSWFVTIAGKRHNLGSDRESAFLKFHELMAKPQQRRSAAADSVVGVFDAFLDWCQRNKAPRTYDWYRERLQWFADAIPNLTIGQLRPFHVQQWVDAHPNWSNGHKRGCITAIQRAFRWALKLGLINDNPIEHIEKPKAGVRDQVISAEEFQTLLGHVNDQQFRDLLSIAWETGARPQELLRVEARHVDLAHSRWVFAPKEAKIKTRPRIVYLTEPALECTKRSMLKIPEGPIFRNTDGRPWHVYAVGCRFERLRIKLGREHIKEKGIATSQHEDRATRRREDLALAKRHGTKYCLYTFRHSFATRLLESGMDALTVALLLGHQDPSMLAKVYQHLSHNPQHLLDQVRRAAM